MDIRITPSKLAGTIPAVPSKSDAHRILIAAALADRQTKIALSSVSKDITATMDTLRAMGAEISHVSGKVTVKPIKPLKTNEGATVNCGESGTTARMILPLMSAVCGGGTLIAEGSLINRPFGTLCSVMEEMGCHFLKKNPPISFAGRLISGDYSIRGDESSQYISGLLFALPLLDDDSRIILTTELQSSGYVDMTIDTLKKFGINITKTEQGYNIRGNRRYVSPGKISVEGDWSNAAFWHAAGVSVSGLNNNSFQKDRSFAELRDKDEIDAAEIPDLVPIFAVCAAATKVKTRIYNISRLRSKESDRVTTIKNMLEAIGAKADEKENEIIIYGRPLTGGTVDGANDHRIVMAAAIASCFCAGDVIIKGAEAVNKSYPTFFADFNSVGGNANVI